VKRYYWVMLGSKCAYAAASIDAGSFTLLKA
jgi:hypothetical protein